MKLVLILDDEFCEVPVPGSKLASAFAIVLSKKDRENIANMSPDATIYAVFPDDCDHAKAEEMLDAIKAEVLP